MSALLRELLRLIATAGTWVCRRIREAFDKTSSRPPGKAKPSFILALPPEILLLINKDLPPHSRILFSQSCSALQVLLGDKGAGARLNYKDHIEYLTALAYDLPTKWVCEECVRLHEFAMSDTPQKPQNTSCPLGWRRLHEGTPFLGLHAVAPHHRHVQMALKAQRLGTVSSQLRRHVNAIMAPSVRPFKVQCSSGGPNALAAHCVTIPRILDGRFVVLTIWVYRRREHPITLSSLGCLLVCHSTCTWWDAICHGRQDIRAYPGSEPFFVGLRSTREAAMMTSDGIASGFCSRCSTDYSVALSPSVTGILSWTDLGPEGSCMRRAWRDFLPTVCRRYSCRVHDPRYGGHGHGGGGARRRPAHAPGSIRRRFDADVLYDLDSTRGVGRLAVRDRDGWVVKVPLTGSR
ncbi:hypothetical protein JDV02_003371 [Purpureocillium takamizusanense]|uniref:F-box domain-containing protein n=1 Tax=Purpureocillium takamizusanense TaxID=2060973 RepID=A0A9Q8QAH2_9HYPO|nr:uncharacterized protein JDV02_003371 [Purpureocillium takamizusanense]UNI16989.1 hypothetical protein JDV02_003371 [Purpureocillium takamizusanense]